MNKPLTAFLWLSVALLLHSGCSAASGGPSSNERLVSPHKRSPFAATAENKQQQLSSPSAKSSSASRGTNRGGVTLRGDDDQEKYFGGNADYKPGKLEIAEYRTDSDKAIVVILPDYSEVTRIHVREIKPSAIGPYLQVEVVRKDSEGEYRGVLSTRKLPRKLHIKGKLQENNVRVLGALAPFDAVSRAERHATCNPKVFDPPSHCRVDIDFTKCVLPNLIGVYQQVDKARERLKIFLEEPLNKLSIIADLPIPPLCTYPEVPRMKNGHWHLEGMYSHHQLWFVGCVATVNLRDYWRSTIEIEAFPWLNGRVLNVPVSKPDLYSKSDISEVWTKEIPDDCQVEQKEGENGRQELRDVKGKYFESGKLILASVRVGVLSSKDATALSPSRSSLKSIKSFSSGRSEKSLHRVDSKKSRDSFSFGRIDSEKLKVSVDEDCIATLDLSAYNGRYSPDMLAFRVESNMPPSTLFITETFRGDTIWNKLPFHHWYENSCGSSPEELLKIVFRPKDAASNELIFTAKIGETFKR